MEIFEKMINVIKRTLEILEEQQRFQNISWTNGVE